MLAFSDLDTFDQPVACKGTFFSLILYLQSIVVHTKLELIGDTFRQLLLLWFVSPLVDTLESGDSASWCCFYVSC